MACCFDNLIGIRGCTNGTPISGLWLNDLQGITIKEAALTAGPETASGQQLLLERLNFAKREIESELAGMLAKTGQFKLNASVSSLQAGYLPGKAKTTTADPSTAKGVRVKTCAQSRFMRIQLTCVNIYPLADQAGAVLSIVDGAKTITKTIDLVANQAVTIPLAYLADTGQVIVTISQDATMQQTTLRKGGCGTCNYVCQSTPHLRMDGWDGSRVSSYTFGLSVEAIAVCPPSAFICQIPTNDLAFMLLYRTAAGLAKEVVYSDRHNYLTLNKERAKELYEHYFAEYEHKAKTVLESMQSMFQHLQDPCVNCRTPKQAWIRR